MVEEKQEEGGERERKRGRALMQYFLGMFAILFIICVLRKIYDHMNQPEIPGHEISITRPMLLPRILW